MRRSTSRVGAIFAALLVALTAPANSSTPDADLVGSAIVRDDASLQIEAKIVRLHGIFIPSDGMRCQTRLRPVRCASRAALALESKIQGMVHCHAVSRNADGSLSATCFVGRSLASPGDNLSAYLLTNGLALAAPDAPFEYVTLERIAEAHGRGMWGFQVDEIRPR
jgi:endonuclease YncB( thermonuclease family)